MFCYDFLQCLDTVGWVTGRKSMPLVSKVLIPCGEEEELATVDLLGNGHGIGSL